MVPVRGKLVNSGVQRGLSDTLTSIGPSPNPNSEGRRPQEIRTPKLESKATSAKQQPLGSGHYRVSDFGLLSGFGFRYSDFRAAAGLWSNPDGQLLPRASNLLQARSLASTRSGGFGVACTCLGGLVTNHESRITPGSVVALVGLARPFIIHHSSFYLHPGVACTMLVPRMYLACTSQSPPNYLACSWLVPGFGWLCPGFSVGSSGFQMSRKWTLSWGGRWAIFTVATPSVHA